MEQIRGSNQLVLTLTCLICLWFSFGMSSDSDPLIKPYLSSSLPSNDGLVSSVQSISESEWDSLVIQSEVPVMVLFTADWCGPCRWLLPTLYVLDLDYKDQFKFYTVDIDKESSIAARNMVRSIPATLVFKGGYIVATYMGTDSGKLRQLVEQYK
ncbi:Thioredoxin domain [Arabidopsis suecica]|uniref:Thioredoxin domain n=1 Tax=Arabidopsis suecica TaxID=45249 RepID=A0A8T2CJ15_ARASU|nr:Thioredoxin domain [Arabidopsis suecica]